MALRTSIRSVVALLKLGLAVSDKLLALNVPTNFATHVSYAEAEIASSARFYNFRRDRAGWAQHRYRKCEAALGGDVDATLALRLFGIECRCLPSAPVGQI